MTPVGAEMAIPIFWIALAYSTTVRVIPWSP